MTEGRKVKVSLDGLPLFEGTEGPGKPPWQFWHRVTPSGYIDLPPRFRIEVTEEEPVTSARIIHEDAARERDQRKIRAGMILSDDIRDANRRYAEELAHAENMYQVRIEDHPLEGS